MKAKMIILASVIIAATACNNSTESTTNSKDTVMEESRETTTVNKTKTVEVAPVVKTKFTEKYPNAKDVQWSYYETAPENFDWEMTGWETPDNNDYTAHYTMDDVDYWSWYSPEGEWIGTVSTISNSQLPAAVNKTLESQFSGYTITSIDKEHDKNRIAYEIKMEKGDDKMKALIDENGNIMKKKGKVDGEKVKEKNL